MTGGYILLHKKILECEWYTDKDVRVLFLDLLVRANYKTTEHLGMNIERGQFIGTIPQMSENSGLTINQVRRCLHVLEEHSSITIERTNKYSIITLCNWDKYQTQKDTEHRQNHTQKHRQNHRQNSVVSDCVLDICEGSTINEAQTKSHAESQTKNQINKNKILNNIKKESNKLDSKEIEADASTTKNDNNISLDDVFEKPKKNRDQLIAEREQREKAFYTSLIPYVEIYGKEMVRAFYDYWREPNRIGTKMKCELQQTWSLSLRLATWNRKSGIIETKQIKYNDNGKSKRQKLNDDFEGLAVEIGQYIASRSGETLPDDVI